MPIRLRHASLVSCILAAMTAFPGRGTAQTADQRWTFRTSALITGSSEISPEGYQALSAVGLGVGMRRQITGIISAELNLAMTSREVVIQGPLGIETSQGSIESVPINLLGQVRPLREGAVHPYAGVGFNFTPVWEKSGALDSDDIAPTFGFAAQVGVDFDVSPGVLVNVDLLWNTAEPDIEAGDVQVATLKMNTFTLSAGVGFRF